MYDLVHSLRSHRKLGVIAQDKADDGPAGIRSTALLFGDRTKPILTGFSAASMSLLTYAGHLNGQGPIFYAAMGLSTLELLRIVWSTKYDSRESCWGGFVGCGRVGLLVSLGLGADYVIDRYQEESRSVDSGAVERSAVSE